MISKFKNQCRFFVVLIMAAVSVLFSSCGNEKNKVDDDTIANDSVSQELDSVLKEDSTVTAIYQLTKEDSTKFVDSIARTKNRIRDFN
ncbi:hypothetical protein BH11BAC7_BH11BAC7_05150 [soil metagenome]